MPEKRPQTISNHRRSDPGFHFILLPLLLLLLIWTIIHLVRHLETDSVAFLGIAVILILMALKMRQYPIKVQDRLIRLEERLRLATLLPEPLLSRISELTESQLIALRFASDAETPALVRRALDEKLDRKQIKEAIREWRPDYWRV
jgi:hypothetical protein